jgi:large subunit ribosomal protein L29
MKQSEIIGLTLEELKERIAIYEQNLQKLKLTHTISAIENPMSIRHTRRSIARMKTELRKRQLETALAK